MIQTRKDFFIQVLDQFATTGNELLQILDDIESGEVECFLEDWVLFFTLLLTHFSNIMHETSKDYFISCLDRFANTGNELLDILDAIETGAIQCHIEEDWVLISYTFFHTLFP